MGVKAHDEYHSHSARKIARISAESKGPTLAALCLANDEVSVKEKPGILIPVQVKTSIPAFGRDDLNRGLGGKKAGLNRVSAMRGPERNT
jgi:hypothetical protein